MAKLKDSATGGVVTIGAEASIDEAIRLLEEHHVRHLPVLREGKLIGMVSAGDVLVTVGGLLSEDRVSTQDATVAYAGPTRVAQIMTTGAVTLSPDEPVAAAARVMLDRQIAAVVLVANDTIAGIVTETDYLRRFFDESDIVPPECRQQPVADHMATDVKTAGPNQNVFALMREMGGRVHHLPVVDDAGNLVGILSDHDVRRALALDKIEQITEPVQRIRLLENFDAGKIMAEDVAVIAPTATLAEAAKQMLARKVGALPVVEEGKLKGIITESDILRACIDALGDD